MTGPQTQQERPARHGVSWSDNELDLLDRAIRAGWTWPEIAARFERKPQAVQGKAMRQAFELYYQRPVDLNDSASGENLANSEERWTR